MDEGEFFNEAWRGERKELRLIGVDEIVLEDDTCKSVKDVKYWLEGVLNAVSGTFSYEVWNHNGKCSHLHFKGFTGLSELSEEQQRNYKKQFILKYGGETADTSLADTRKLIPTENELHWKKVLGKKGCEKYGIKQLIEKVNDGVTNDINNDETLLKKVSEAKSKTTVNYDEVGEELLKELVLNGYEILKGNKLVCPFHNETEPSFQLYPQNNSYYCFGCKKSGKITDLLVKKNEVIDLNNLPITNCYLNVKKYYSHQPFFFDKSNMFWFWNKKSFCYAYVDEIDIMNNLDNKLNYEGRTVDQRLKGQYIESFKRVGRDNIPKPAKVSWVQFMNRAYSLVSGKFYNVTPDFFFTNPIPYKVGDCSDTPTLDKLFKEWVGEKHVTDLYEIMAYCCYTDYPIQTYVCLYGSGRNGKGQFLRLLVKFLGLQNTCSTELELIAGHNSSRFETFKLYKKLLCTMGETNFNGLKSTSLLKKLVGGDLIGFEKKGKDGFDDYNYAKIVISTNTLPSSDDMSDGFIRRWHIIDFPNEFPEGKDIWKTVPEVEFENLAHKVTEILPVLLERGSFTNQGSIEDRERKYVLASNPLPMFLKAYCKYQGDGFIRYGELYKIYTKFLAQNKRRIVVKKEFSKCLIAEGYENRRTTKDGVTDQYIEGLVWKNGSPDSDVFGDFGNLRVET